MGFFDGFSSRPGADSDLPEKRDSRDQLMPRGDPAIDRPNRVSLAPSQDPPHQ
jgi:hypothetical protein